MASKWAYTGFGRLVYRDVWNWFGPTDPFYDDPLVTKLYVLARDETHKMPVERGMGIIGFDGKRWLSGHFGLPSTALDPTTFPKNLYDRDAVGRPIHFLHGYISEEPAFPASLPIVDRERFAALHKENLIPLWDRSLAHKCRELKPQVTTFERGHANGSIIDHLPKDAVAELTRAHSEGRPVALRYDLSTKEWAALPKFEKELQQALAEQAEHQARRQGNVPGAKTSAASAPNWATPIDNARKAMEDAKKRAESAQSWVGRLWDHPGGKFAIIGGTVVLGAILGYWVFQAKSAKPKDKAERDRG